MGSESQYRITPKHYEMPITPIEFIMANNLGFCEANVVKYICRYSKKNGREDLEKAKHYIEMLIDHNYPEVELEDID